MQLNNFSSFFEIMAGLNLAYATSDWFKSAIDRKVQNIDQVKKIAEKKIELIKSKRTVVEQSDSNSDLISANLLKLNEKIIKAEQIRKDEETFEKIKTGYRSIFLMTALYCFTILLLGGFEQFFVFSTQEINPQIQTQHILTNTFLFFFHFVIFYNLYVFVRSHSELIKQIMKKVFKKNHNLTLEKGRFIKFIEHNFFNYEKDTNNLLIIIIWTTSLIAIYIFIIYFPFLLFTQKLNWQSSYIEYFIPWGSKTNLLLALLIALSPYLLHFLRVYIHDVRYYYKLMKFNLGLEQMIQQFEHNVEVYAVQGKPLPLPTINEPEGMIEQSSNLWNSFCTNISILWKALRREMNGLTDIEINDENECCFSNHKCERHSS